MSSTHVRRRPALGALSALSLASAAALASDARAQAVLREPYDDPYRAGPTRPLDGSPRSGVYSARPVPSFDPAPRGVGSSSPIYDAPVIWHGVYAGLLAGHRWTTTDASNSELAALSGRGWQFGGHLGRNFQAGSIVFGVEGDLMLGSTSAPNASGANAITSKETWTTSLRARAGYAFGSTLVYATGGLGLSGQEVSLASGGLAAKLSETRYGLVFGGGLELQLTHAMSARMEALRTNYRDSTLALGNPGQSVKSDSTTVRAGLSFRFN